jgi:CRP/FNR family transcriptional regulator, cyclic AMP receptor protein
MNGTGKLGSPGGLRWPRGTLMSRLDAESAEELLHLANGQAYRPGAVLIRAGAPGTHVYLLQSAQRAHSACVKTTATSESGIETMLGIRASGDVVGELAVLGRTPRTATVTACTALTAYAIPGEIFTAFLDRRPQAWAAVSLMIAERLEWANRRRVDYAGHDATIHIARVIADILDLYGRPSAEGGEELGVSLSQPELGSLVGISKEAVARAIRRLRDKGLVETQYRRIVVCDSVGLRSFAGLPAR